METNFFRLSIDHLKQCITEGLHYVEYRDADGGRVYKFSALHARNIRAAFVGARELSAEEVATLQPRLGFK